MYSGCVAVLVLALFGASAQAFCAQNLGLTAVGGTPVTENCPLALPSQIAPATVQDTCNVVKTFIRPTVRQEVYNIPSVQRFVQTTSSPIVETVPFVGGSAATVPTTCVNNPGLVGGYGYGPAGVVGGYGAGVVGGYGAGVVGGYGTGLVGGCGLGGGLVGGAGLGGCGLGSGLVGGCGLGSGLVGGCGLGSGLVGGCAC